MESYSSLEGLALILPWEKRSVISNHFTELVLEITEIGMVPLYTKKEKNKRQGNKKGSRRLMSLKDAPQNRLEIWGSLL